MEMNGSHRARRVYVFDSPRTCSQLFNKLFAAHPQLTQVFHPFMGASVYGPERIWNKLKHCDNSEAAYTRLAKAAGLDDETYSAATTRLEMTVQDIEASGKVPWVKDHCLCVVNPDLFLQGAQLPKMENPTVLSDDLLHSVTPIFLIRHPALMIPSFYRKQKPIFHEEAAAEDFWALTSLRWARTIFDTYTHSLAGIIATDGEISATTAFPIVIEAEDIIYITREIVGALCDRLGIDAAGVQYEWEALSPESKQWPPDPIMQVFFKELLTSSGVCRARKPAEVELDVSLEYNKWVAEFGEEDAKALRVLVGQTIPDYVYLRKHKLRV